NSSDLRQLPAPPIRAAPPPEAPRRPIYTSSLTPESLHRPLPITHLIYSTVSSQIKLQRRYAHVSAHDCAKISAFVRNSGRVLAPDPVVGPASWVHPAFQAVAIDAQPLSRHHKPVHLLALQVGHVDVQE